MGEVPLQQQPIATIIKAICDENSAVLLQGEQL